MKHWVWWGLHLFFLVVLVKSYKIAYLGIVYTAQSFKNIIYCRQGIWLCRVCICTVLEMEWILHRCCVRGWKLKGDKEEVGIKRKKQQGELITKQSCSMEWDWGGIWNQKRCRVFAARVTCAWGMYTFMCIFKIVFLQAQAKN